VRSYRGDNLLSDSNRDNAALNRNWRTRSGLENNTTEEDSAPVYEQPELFAGKSHLMDFPPQESNIYMSVVLDLGQMLLHRAELETRRPPVEQVDEFGARLIPTDACALFGRGECASSERRRF
jgi:hypothetical protein